MLKKINTKKNNINLRKKKKYIYLFLKKKRDSM
jgi:hypothetical protein